MTARLISIVYGSGLSIISSFPKFVPTKKLFSNFLLIWSTAVNQWKDFFSVDISIIVLVRFRIPVNQSNSDVLGVLAKGRKAIISFVKSVRQYETTRIRS